MWSPPYAHRAALEQLWRDSGMPGRLNAYRRFILREYRYEPGNPAPITPGRLSPIIRTNQRGDVIEMRWPDQAVIDEWSGVGGAVSLVDWDRQRGMASLVDWSRQRGAGLLADWSRYGGAASLVDWSGQRGSQPPEPRGFNALPYQCDSGDLDEARQSYGYGNPSIPAGLNFTYDALGRLSEVQYAGGGTDRMVYDAFNRPVLKQSGDMVLATIYRGLLPEVHGSVWREAAGMAGFDAWYADAEVAARWPPGGTRAITTDSTGGRGFPGTRRGREPRKRSTPGPWSWP
jgi:hypothetical protein